MCSSECVCPTVCMCCVVSFPLQRQTKTHDNDKCCGLGQQQEEAAAAIRTLYACVCVCEEVTGDKDIKTKEMKIF